MINLEKISPMMKQYCLTKEQYKDCILFYRLGDFYEMFFEDAKIASKELSLVLTSKDCGLDERAPMCGIPFHAYESYAQRLIEKGYKVAICEQTEDFVGKVMDRKVVRIITPGTVIDNSMLDQSSNTYMMCIYLGTNSCAYAYGDLSTGDIFVGNYQGADVSNYLNDQIVRIMPQEIICNNKVKAMENNLTCIKTNEKFKLNEYYDWAFNYNNCEKDILKQYSLASLKGFDFAVDKANVVAIGVLFEYYKETQKRDFKHFKLPKLIKDEQYMYLDTNTRRNLEIESTMHDNSKIGSLVWVLNKTETSGGARLLRSWIRQPLQNITDINARLDYINLLVDNPIGRENIGNSLSQVQDIERILGRISYGSVKPKECLSLANSLKIVPEIKQELMQIDAKKFENLILKCVDVSSIVDLLVRAIDPEAPNLLKDGNFIKSGFNVNLDNLRNSRKIAQDKIVAIQAREREETGIKTLKISYNKIFGYYIEVGKQYQSQVPYSYIRKQTTSNSERYITEELKEIEDRIISSHDEAIKLEEQIFEQLRLQLIDNIDIIQSLANLLSEIDCYYSLSTVAVENNYVRPSFNTNGLIEIETGRHPVVEKINKMDFIPNDCSLNTNEQRTMILTGPNMAGKSTYMRQVALITIMAHIGCYVPATSANICIVDRIFTRIGASDDLAVGQSTFMVEMIEVANILNFATDKSLIVLDEVGRGTSTFDGLSIAWAVVEYLSKHLKAKTMFATHYHELMKLEGIYDGVKNFCISIKEIGGKLVFLRKIMRGSVTKSYGIEVASLAGLPQTVIDRAKELINDLETENANTSSQIKDSEVYNILSEIDINKMSPLSAFDTLSHLVELTKKEK